MSVVPTPGPEDVLDSASLSISFILINHQSTTDAILLFHLNYISNNVYTPRSIELALQFSAPNTPPIILLYLSAGMYYIANTIYKQTHLQYTQYDYVVYYIFLHALLHNCE